VLKPFYHDSTTEKSGGHLQGASAAEQPRDNQTGSLHATGPLETFPPSHLAGLQEAWMNDDLIAALHVFTPFTKECGRKARYTNRIVHVKSALCIQLMLLHPAQHGFIRLSDAGECNVSIRMSFIRVIRHGQSSVGANNIFDCQTGHCGSEVARMGPSYKNPQTK
jgi:hypothetical protein